MSIRLYIGNLPEEVTRQELEEVLGSSEEVVSLKVITDRKTGKCRGFGFLTVGTTEAADSFIEKFNGVEFKGVTLRVEKAQPKAKTERPEGEAPSENVIVKSESTLIKSESAIVRTESAIVRNESGIIKSEASAPPTAPEAADVTDASVPAPEAPTRTTPAVNISRPIRKQNKERQEQNRERQERSDSRRRERDGNRGDSNRGDRQPQVVSSSDEAGQPDPRWADALLDIRRQLTKA